MKRFCYNKMRHAKKNLKVSQELTQCMIVEFVSFNAFYIIHTLGLLNQIFTSMEGKRIVKSVEKTDSTLNKRVNVRKLAQTHTHAR